MIGIDNVNSATFGNIPIMNAVLPGIVCSNFFRVGLMNLATELGRWKNSVLIKRIGITPVTRLQFVIGNIMFYLFFSGLVTLWTLVVSFLMAHWDNEIDLLHIDWGGFFYGFFVAIILATSMGFFIVGLTADVTVQMSIAILLFLPGALLSGQFIPITVIQTDDVLNIISHITPQRYISQIFYDTFTVYHGGVSPWHTWVYVTVPWFFIGGFLGAMLLTFKWV